MTGGDDQTPTGTTETGREKPRSEKEQLELFAGGLGGTGAGDHPGVRLAEVAPGVAGIVFDATDGGQNVLSFEVLNRLQEIVRAIRSAPQFRAVLVKSARPGSFVAGADVRQIADVHDEATARQAARLGQLTFVELSELTIPVVAAIDGACLGGGLELALACHYRIVSDSSKVRLGLPEVRLGIIPGFGGTQRLPRLIGLTAALDLILTGKSLDPKRAKRRGLVDLVIPEVVFARESLAFTERLAAGKAPFRGLPAFEGPRKAMARQAPRSLQDRVMESPVGAPLVFRISRKKTLATTKGHYQAPITALDVLAQTWRKPLEDGLAIEADALARRVASPEKDGLVHLFFLSEANRKDDGVEGRARPREVTRAGLLGAGTMGGGIAQLLSRRDIPVRMKDLDDGALLAGLRAASDVYRRDVKRRRMRPVEMERKLGLIRPTLDYTGFGRVEVIFEAVVEKMSVKQAVLRDVEAVSGPDTIFASNTSALSISELASVSSRPDRVAGFHFFNPVHRMPLVEVIRGRSTSDETIATLMALARRLGKTPILCTDGPGFLVNRILGRYLNEASHLLAEGVTVERCDQVALDFGMPMGPIRLVDEIGADVAAKVAAILLEGLGERYQTNNLIERLVGEGRLGKKTGRGFYLHPSKSGRRLPLTSPEKERVDPAARALIETGGRRGEASDREIRDRLVLVMVDEAARCLDEGIVRSAADVDLGMVFGTGFPPFRGGLLRFADGLGVREVSDTLARFAETVSPRFAPSDALRDRAARGVSFTG